MAFQGNQRNRSSLYKPTDFVSKNRMGSVAPDKNEEKQVILKIQQRPNSEQKNTAAKESSKKPELANTTETMKANINKKVDGVSEKDAAKIQRLQEYMAKLNANPGLLNKSNDIKEKHSTANKAENNLKVANKATKQKNDKKPMENPVRQKKQEPKSVKQKTNLRNQSFQNQNTQEGLIGANSYYANPSFHGFPHQPNEMPWLQMRYPINSNGQSILGTPFNSQPQLTHFKTERVSHSPSKVNNAPQLPVSEPFQTAPNGNQEKQDDKKKSLDFVKDFFNNDPEVQYMRKQSKEKKAVNRVPDSTKINTSQEGDHVQQGQGNNLMQECAVQQIQHPIASHGALYQQPQQQINASSGYHTATSLLQPVAPQSNIPPSLATSNYQHMTATPGTYSHNPMQQPSNYHDLIHRHQTFHHPSYQHQPGAMLSTSSANHSLYQHQNAIHGNYSQYAVDFSLSRNSHVGHVKQHLKENVMTDILYDVSLKPQKWQKQALSKCGPIESSQARSLITQLIDGTYECMICCDSIKWDHEIWNCNNCFHIFHLKCIKKWARSDTASVKGIIQRSYPSFFHITKKHFLILKCK